MLRFDVKQGQITSIIDHLSAISDQYTAIHKINYSGFFKPEPRDLALVREIRNLTAVTKLYLKSIDSTQAALELLEEFQKLYIKLLDILKFKIKEDPFVSFGLQFIRQFKELAGVLLERVSSEVNLNYLDDYFETIRKCQPLSSNYAFLRRDLLDILGQYSAGTRLGREFPCIMLALQKLLTEDYGININAKTDDDRMVNVLKVMNDLRFQLIFHQEEYFLPKLTKIMIDALEILPAKNNHPDVITQVLNEKELLLDVMPYVSLKSLFAS